MTIDSNLLSMMREEVAWAHWARFGSKTNEKEGTMSLFEVAILEKPTKKEEENGAQERLALGPIAIVAKTADQAKVVAGRMLGNDVATERLEVLVRPFV